MRKINYLIYLVCVSASLACIKAGKSASKPINTEVETYVYLCNSSGGKKYHYSRSCRGLSRCKASIIKVTLQEAQKRGKTLCGWED